MILELEFTGEKSRDSFREPPAVVASLGAVPDPVVGLSVYPGRGGSSGANVPRRSRPAPAGGAAAVDEPRDLFLDLDERS